MSLSVIIPTFDSIEFIGELITSIQNNKYDNEFEILFGIDGCEKTLEYVKTQEFPKNFFFYYLAVKDSLLNGTRAL